MKAIFNDGTGAQFVAAARKRFFGGLTQADHEGQNQPVAVSTKSQPQSAVDVSPKADICEVCHETFSTENMVTTGSGDRVCKSCCKLV